MSVFSKESKRKDYKPVATFLPPREFSYLTLFTLARSTTKAKIIKDAVDQWICTQKTQYPEAYLIQEITTHLNMRWKIDKSQGIISFSDFKDVVKLELTEKGIKENQITTILSELKQ